MNTSLVARLECIILKLKKEFCLHGTKVSLKKLKCLRGASPLLSSSAQLQIMQKNISIKSFVMVIHPKLILMDNYILFCFWIWICQPSVRSFIVLLGCRVQGDCQCSVLWRFEWVSCTWPITKVVLFILQ